MKQLLIACMLFGSSLSYGQKLIQNEVDKFEKVSVKKTNWCALMKKKGYARPYRAEFQVCQVGDKEFVKVKMMLNNQVYSIKQGDKLSFLMSDGSIVSLPALTYVVTSMGDGAVGNGGSANLGTEATYSLTPDQKSKFFQSVITTIRIETSIGYVEQEEKYNLDKHLKRCLELMN